MPSPLLLWVTRTGPFNLLTAQRLRAMGHEVLAIPLFDIEPVAGSGVAQRPDLIAFTSINGVRHHCYRPEWHSVPVFAVGDAIAAAARRRGYRRVRSANGNVEDLKALILGSAATGSRLIHFSASEPAGDLVPYLGRRGFDAMQCSVYQALARPGQEALSILTGEPHLEGIVIHSGRAARRAAELALLSGWSGRIFCLAESQAEAFVGVPQLTVDWAARPTERALMERIRQMTIGPDRHRQSAGLPGKATGAFVPASNAANDNCEPAPTPA